MPATDLQLGPIGPAAAVDELRLEGGEERLGNRDERQCWGWWNRRNARVSPEVLDAMKASTKLVSHRPRSDAKAQARTDLLVGITGYGLRG